MSEGGREGVSEGGREGRKVEWEGGRERGREGGREGRERVREGTCGHYGNTVLYLKRPQNPVSDYST